MLKNVMRGLRWDPKTGEDFRLKKKNKQNKSEITIMK